MVPSEKIDTSQETMLTRLPLRIRKKKKTEETILLVAKQLFRERGYARVTVPEIADEANVSVKTVFNYFGSKEELAFREEVQFCDQLILHILSRKQNQSIFDAFQNFIWTLIQSIDPDQLIESLPGFHPWMDDPALEQRYLLLWENYEKRITDALQLEFGKNEFDPVLRVIACQMVSILKTLGSKDFKVYLTPIPGALRYRALEKWTLRSLDLVSGIRNHLSN
ncbi:TetR/AcrR family transcriptional regulator [Leptospira biflexa]|jgi:AcrR family transcriptional regulator|uniref:TetR/AcrR family transcriptional regulator n=1 Tax=Leptospira biflexa TaxID=172 RepID=UPI0010846994|nr:TetR/AcrR family transcriptional regulator [Leptospira biflexa]TGM34530.1 TetR/AcrR family transcriptional regulator [Leptospira biflexa]TGM35632.1 TetR/AcrR family transcriptional regulator [Leptospira biflexa]TGM57542.1 TetR/AcrR family transcriptional regulator [Leptospira biflexa]